MSVPITVDSAPVDDLFAHRPAVREPHSVQERHPHGNGNPDQHLLDYIGDMQESLNHRVESDGVTIGFDDPKAVYHEGSAKHVACRTIPDLSLFQPAEYLGCS